MSASPTGEPEPPPAPSDATPAVAEAGRFPHLPDRAPAASDGSRLLRIAGAVVEVVLICGVPTQLVVLFGFVLARGLPADLDHAPLEFVAMTSLIDTALVAVLIRIFLGLSGETSRDVFIGPRRPFGEIWRGLLLVPVTILAVQLIAYGLKTAFPALHNVEENPYAAYMRSPTEAAIFIVVVILAGGVREELQRAFIIRRFDQYLGGAKVGLALFSVLFGALHYPEGIDAAIAIGLLGLFFGVLYIRRQSAVMPITTHAGFDVGMVLIQVLGKG